MALLIASYLATLVVTHYLASFIQMSLHYLLGHQRRLGSYFHRNHLMYHHALYSKRIMVSGKYVPEEKTFMFYYIIPAVALAAAASSLLPYDLLILHVSVLSLSYAAHIYLHTHYHLSDTWLRRFRWFRKKQQLHVLHHKDMSKNLALIDFVWDRIFGSYEDVAANTST